MFTHMYVIIVLGTNAENVIWQYLKLIMPFNVKLMTVVFGII